MLRNISFLNEISEQLDLDDTDTVTAPGKPAKVRLRLGQKPPEKTPRRKSQVQKVPRKRGRVLRRLPVERIGDVGDTDGGSSDGVSYVGRKPARRRSIHNDGDEVEGLGRTAKARIYANHWKFRTAYERKAVDPSSESELSDSNFGTRPAVRHLKGWRASRDRLNCTTRYWWDGAIKQRVDNRRTDNEECLMFNFEPAYLNDSDHNIVGQGILAPDQPPDQIGNPMQETPLEEMTIEERDELSALRTRLQKVLNFNFGVAAGHSAPPRGDGVTTPSLVDQHVFNSYVRPVISSCVVYVVMKVLEVTEKEAKRLLVEQRTRLLMKYLDKNIADHENTEYKLYAVYGTLLKNIVPWSRLILQC